MEQAKEQWDLNKITGPRHIDYKVYEEITFGIMSRIMAGTLLYTFEDAVLRGSIKTVGDLKKITHNLGFVNDVG